MKRIPTSIAVVAAALIDRRGRVLLQRRRPDRQHGGLWEFPGGKLEAGETDVSGLIREIREELGVELDPGDLLRLDQASDADGGLVITLYTCRLWQGEPKCLDADAIDWFTPKEVLALPIPPLDRPLAEALRQWLHKG
ncbi:MAG: (deoxy)nucleoside triphosphate pyrophosphohydrolase [Novosphingobium sp.]